MFASVQSFEEVQVCTAASQVPQTGVLIGEGGGHVLLGQQFGGETSVVSLPSEQVTKTEYGDLSSTFSCPGPPGAAVAAKVAVEELGGHASPAERQLAIALRPRIRFDSQEPWRPIEVGTFLAERFEDGGGHGACERGADPPCPTVAGLRQLRARPGAPPTSTSVARRPTARTTPRRAKAACARRPRSTATAAAAVVYYRRG